MSGLDVFEKPWLARSALWFSLLAVVAFVLWAAFADIDQVTRAQGSVIASSRTQVIQSLEGGIAAEIRVREGDVVEKGQVLVRLDRTKVEASYLESRARAVGLAAILLRLKAETFGTPLRFPPSMLKNYPEITNAQQTLYEKRQRALQEELASIEKGVALALQELALNEPLLKTGDVSEVDVLRLRRQITDLEAQATNKRNRYFQDAQAELAKAEEDLAGVEQVVAQRKDQLDRIELTAPVRGIVKNVRMTTVGGVVRPGDEVMQIVPTQDNLLIEAKVRPADAAFLKPGLPATIKLDAYDYTIYGSLKGELTYISADTFSEENRAVDQTYYRVHVETTDRRLSAKGGERIEIIPGMTGTVEVTTGSNTVLRYLVKPIAKAANEALRER
jgi:membrane fusion protein, adhesin transport system